MRLLAEGSDHRRELMPIAEVLRRHPAVSVLSDEIYSEVSFTGLPAPSLAAVAPDLRHRVLVVSGVSKSYAMTGWRRPATPPS